MSARNAFSSSRPVGHAGVIEFMGWAESLRRETLPEAGKERDRGVIRQFLRHCHSTGQGVTVASARAFLEKARLAGEVPSGGAQSVGWLRGRQRDQPLGGAAQLPSRQALTRLHHTQVRGRAGLALGASSAWLPALRRATPSSPPMILPLHDSAGPFPRSDSVRCLPSSCLWPAPTPLSSLAWCASVRNGLVGLGPSRPSARRFPRSTTPAPSTGLSVDALQGQHGTQASCMRAGLFRSHQQPRQRWSIGGTARTCRRRKTEGDNPRKPLCRWGVPARRARKWRRGLARAGVRLFDSSWVSVHLQPPPSPLAFHRVVVPPGDAKWTNNRTDRRGRPVACKLETDVARPRSVQ